MDFQEKRSLTQGVGNLLKGLGYRSAENRLIIIKLFILNLGLFYIYCYLITSAKGILFYGHLFCQSVCLFVSRITEILLIGNFVKE